MGEVEGVLRPKKQPLKKPLSPLDHWKFILSLTGEFNIHDNDGQSQSRWPVTANSLVMRKESLPGTPALEII